MIDGVGVAGTLRMKVYDRSGDCVSFEYKNLITSWGLTQLATALTGTPMTPDVEFIAIGTGTTEETVTDSGLGSETFRQAAVVTQLTGDNANKVTFYALWGEGVIDGIVSEAGLFNDASAGDMFNRKTFPQVTVGPTNTFEVTWTVAFT